MSRYLKFLKVLLLLTIVMSCKDDRELISPPIFTEKLSGRVVFSFAPAGESHPGGRSKDTSSANTIEFSLQKNDGTIVSRKKELYVLGNDFITDPIEFEVGIYALVQFLVLDSDNKVLFAAPTLGSEMADLVDVPLPIPVNVTSEATSHIIPQVVAVEGHSAGDFGYVAFSFDVRETLDLETIYTVADNTGSPATGSLSIIAKDEPLGEAKWTKTFPISGPAKIRIPARFTHYSFIASMDGYISHEQHFMKNQLAANPQLPFEFIPVSLDGFEVFESDDNALKIYLPNDENRCKLYARIDVAEGYKVEYFFADKEAVDRGEMSVAVLEIRECTSEPGVPSFCMNRVNAFDNRSFNSSEDYCARIDFSATTLAHSLADINLGTFVFVNYRRYDAPQNPLFYERATIWRGANN